jgi:hypothetical protein
MLGYLSFLFIMLITVLFARIIHAVATYPLSLAALEATPDPHDLTGRQILSTDLITCGEDSDSVMTWVNESDQTIYITKAQVWMGMYKGSISDFAVWVQRDGKYGARSSTLIHSNWDHYTDPVSPDHYIQMDYSPHYTSVEPGEVLALHSFCSNLEDSNAVGHATLTIWYYQ